MDRTESAPKGFSAEGLAKIAPTLQPIVESGDLSGFVTLLFRHGEIAQLNTLGFRDIEAYYANPLPDVRYMEIGLG